MMPDDVKVIDHTATCSMLADAMQAAINRFETIQETHPDIALDHDLKTYREALGWYRRIPSPAKRACVFASEECSSISDTRP